MQEHDDGAELDATRKQANGEGLEDDGCDRTIVASVKDHACCVYTSAITAAKD